MSANFYVWYRIDGDEAECEQAIRGMMTRLGCRTGIAGQLLKKRNEARLWMEIYNDVADPDTFQVRLSQAVAEFDIEMFIDGPRHSECFIAEASPLPGCATAHCPP